MGFRDQSEDRTMPRAIAVAVQNPTGVKPGLYWAVYDRTNLQRVSVWFKSPWTASKEADTWEQQYGAGAWKPVHPDSINMVWEIEPTHLDGYVYQPGAA